MISIIAVLAGLAFPAFQGVQNSAKKAQAKNDITQLVTAVNAYYTEYGKYPLTAAQNQDYTYGSGGGAASNADLIKILQNAGNPADNPRGIVFYSGPQAKSATGYGIQPSGGSTAYQFNDPWGHPYSVRIDSDYDGKLKEPDNTTDVTNGVIAWSLGRDNDWAKGGISSWK